MNARQFEQLRVKRARRALRPLLASPAAQRLLRSAAANLRLRERVIEELGRHIPAEWIPQVIVEGSGPAIDLRVCSRRIADALRTQLGALRSALRKRLPGLESLRVIISGPGGESAGREA